MYDRALKNAPYHHYLSSTRIQQGEVISEKPLSIEQKFSLKEIVRICLLEL